MLAHVSSRVRKVRVNLVLLILRYILLKVDRRNRYGPAVREVTVSPSVLGANLVHVLRTRSFHSIFLNFFTLLTSAELLRVLFADTLHILGPAHVVPLAVAGPVSIIRSHHLLYLKALNLQHLLHIALHLSLLVYALKTIQIVHARQQTARRLLLYLNFHIVEHSVKVDRVQFYGHLDGRVLLEVNKWLLYFLVDQAARALYSPALILADLLAVKDYQLHEPLDHDYSIVWLASHWVLAERQLK